MPEWYLRWSATSDPAFISSWTNVDVVVAALVVFTLLFALGAAMQANWMSELAFLSVVVGGILVSWPAMVALSIVAAVVVAVVSITHSFIAPKRSAQIEAKAEAIAQAAAADFARDFGVGDRRPPP